MKRNGGPILATSLQGPEQSEETPDQRPGGGRSSTKARGSREVQARSSRRPLYDDSISEFRDHLAWARRQASIAFIAGIVLLFGELTGFLYLVTHANDTAASTVLKPLVANLWSSFGVAGVPVILLFSVGYTFLNHISRTHDEMSTADSKRGASLLADDPAVCARLADHLMEVDRNPKLKLDESVADIERTRRPLKSLLTAVLGVVREIMNGRRVRVWAQTTQRNSRKAVDNGTIQRTGTS